MSRTSTSNSGPFSFPGKAEMGNWHNNPPTSVPKTNAPDWFKKGSNPESSNLKKGSGPISDTNFNFGAPVTTTMGEMANYRIPYRRITKTVFQTSDDMSITQINQFMWTKKISHVDYNANKRNPYARHIMLNLPSLNYFLAKTKKIYETPSDVLDDWFLDGVCVSEEGGEYANQYPDEFGRDRVFNVIVKGRITTYNLFDGCREKDDNGIATGQAIPNLQDGTKCFFIIKGCTSNEELSFELHPSKTEKIKPNNNIYMQIYAFADHKYQYPPMHERAYKDENDITRYGKVVYVGRAESCSAQNNPNMTQQHLRQGKPSNSSISEIVLKPSFIIHFDPKVC